MSARLTLGSMRYFAPGSIATVPLPLPFATETRRTYSNSASARQHTSDCFSTSRYKVEVHDRITGYMVVNVELAYSYATEDDSMGLRLSPIEVVGWANWSHAERPIWRRVDGHLECALVEIFES